MRRPAMRLALSLFAAAVLAVLALLLPTAANAAPRAEVADNDDDDSFAVVGYLPEYRLSGFDYGAAFRSGLTHLLFFSLEVGPDGSPSALDRLPSGADAEKARVAADGVGGKILLSFGGNARSQNFGEMAIDAGRRGRFLSQLEGMMRKYGFDGVDYNWEYPRNQAEWSAWGVLMDETKRLLGGQCIVTFTMYLDPRHYDVIRRYDLLNRADYVHCMAYDQPGRHSTVEFFERGIRLAKEKGFDLSKLTMGVPFYARDVRTGEPKTYAEIEGGLSDDTQDEHQSLYFNSRGTITRKTRIALDAGLGGIMIWELGQDVQPLDDPRSLMTATQVGLSAEAERRGDEF